MRFLYVAILLLFPSSLFAWTPNFYGSSPTWVVDLMEGGGTTTIDRVSGRNKGTITGAAWVSGQGRKSYGLSFDGGGTNGVAFSESQSLGGIPIALYMRALPGGPMATARMGVGMGEGSGVSTYLGHGNNGVTVQHFDAQWITTVRIPTGTTSSPLYHGWYYRYNGTSEIACLILDTDTVNTISCNERAPANIPNFSNNELYLGYAGWGDLYWTGTIDYAAVWIGTQSISLQTIWNINNDIRKRRQGGNEH